MHSPHTLVPPVPAHDPDLPGTSGCAARARVIAVDAGRVLLEPLPPQGCAGCGSATLCEASGIGTPARRLEARRFETNEAPPGLRAGDIVDVDCGGRHLVRAAAIAYAVPLLASLVGAGSAEALLGGDAAAIAGAATGLLAGVLAAKRLARRLRRRGALHARVLRRHDAEDAAFADGAHGHA